MNNLRLVSLFLLLSVFTLAACNTDRPAGSAPSASSAASAASPEAFIADAEKKLADLSVRLGRAQWIQSNFITEDSESLSAQTNEEFIAVTTALAETARKFDGQNMSPDTARKIKLLKLSLSMPAPADPVKRKELTEKAAKMEGDYGKGKYCPDGEKGKCFNLDQLSATLAENRNPEELKKAWLGWHSVAASHRDEYAKFVELINEGAREMGFKDAGAMWRSNYDMEPDAFAAEMERLWQQIKPLYDSLHTYTRKQLIKKYGDKAVPATGPIPAHLLGNMWSQQWGNIYPLLKPM
ncbi:MAG: M2 family metallopeptidase, partial [Blastocatellia bacterium]